MLCIFENNAYFCTIDYEQQKVRVLKYDIVSKTTTDVHTATFNEENQPYTINVENEYLSFACSNEIKVFNLPNNEIVFELILPGSVEYVYAVSYDSANNLCAIYYADNNSEDIGILKEGDKTVSSVFTFSPNHYAYQDKIECFNGHIYWTAQANVTGLVTEHYKFIDYNYLEHKANKIDKSFNFYRKGNDLYILRFNKDGEYTHIDLCTY